MTGGGTCWERGWSEQKRRQIVEETFRCISSDRASTRDASQPGVTLAKAYEPGLLEVKPVANKLLPVRISEVVTNGRLVPGQKVSRAACGTIYIEIANARIRFEGGADPESIRAALESLQR